MIRIMPFVFLSILVCLGCNQEPEIDPNDPKNHPHWDDCIPFNGGDLYTSALSFNTPSLDDPEVNVKISVQNGDDDTFDLTIKEDRYELRLFSLFPASFDYPELDFYDEGKVMYDSGEIYIDEESRSLKAQSMVQFISDDGWESNIIDIKRSCGYHQMNYHRKITETDSVSVTFFQTE